MILALQTDGPVTHLFAMSADGKVIRREEWASGRELADKLLMKIRGLHESQSQDLTGIVIFSGPGSFTSLRIGHAVANALADSLGIPVVGTKGENWLVEGAAALKTTKPGVTALPHYGAEAHITKPRTPRGGPKS